MRKSLSVQFMIGIVGTLALALGLMVAIEYNHQQAEADKSLLSKAELVAKQKEATGAFLSRSNQKRVHGDLTQPLGPSEVSSGVDELFFRLVGTQVKRTRLVVRNDKNTPDEFERGALIHFTEDPEATELHLRTVGPDGVPVFRYMKALRAEASCLECHGDPRGEIDRTGHVKEGMKEGDLAGAISVTLPLTPTLEAVGQETVKLVVASAGVSLVTLLLLWILLYRQVSLPLKHLVAVAGSVGEGRIRIRPEELKPLNAAEETAVVAEALAQMSERLHDLYARLEHRVAERTAQLEAANGELARSGKLKSEFLAMVSHEFRTPLTSIITFTELLLGGAAGRLNAEQNEYLSDVLESSGRLLQMINDLLDMTRLEAGKVRLFREALNATDLIRQAEQTIRPLAERSRLTVRTEIAGDLPLVHADSLRITQVLLNLLGNAIKFTPPGGMITVSARTVGKFVLVAVADTGIGIAPEEQGEVFDAFRQSGRERPEGSGLGLALARSFVELHGGRIWFNSEPGVGTTFWFTLPVLAHEGEADRDDEPQADPGGGR